MKRVLITGASSGVGRELAIILSREYRLIINGRNTERLQETAKQCANDPIIWEYDLSKIDTLEKDIGSFIIENALEINGFVHCAGVMKMLPLRSINNIAFQDVYSVNVFAPAIISKALTARKINGKNLTSVVFISSNISNMGAAAFSVYGSSKSALDGLMRSMAVELAPTVRVNSVLPGGMITEMTKDIFADEKTMNKFAETYPLGIGTPEKIAPMVSFLLSDDSSWITGQQYTVDGGRSINITER